MTVNSNNLFYLCSLVEFIGRTQGLERKAVVNLLGADNQNRIYEQADVLHCEPIEKIADEYIHYFDIQKGSFDNVGSCRYTVPDHFTIGKVYQRLIEDTLTDDNLIPHIMEVYNSWVSDGISNYNTDFYYQPRAYIALCYKENKLIAQFDHIPDHNALWGTRKQCGKERQRATFPE